MKMKVCEKCKRTSPMSSLYCGFCREKFPPVTESCAKSPVYIKSNETNNKQSTSDSPGSSIKKCKRKSSSGKAVMLLLGAAIGAVSSAVIMKGSNQKGLLPASDGTESSSTAIVTDSYEIAAPNENDEENQLYAAASETNEAAVTTEAVKETTVPVSAAADEEAPVIEEILPEETAEEAEVTEESADIVYGDPVPLLEECPPYKTDNYEAWENLPMGAVNYATGISVGRTGYTSGKGYAIFNLDRKYVRLTFDVGNIDNRGVAVDQVLCFLIDDKPALTIDLVPGALPVSYVLDLTGARQLKIQSTKWGGDYGIANMYITEANFPPDVFEDPMEEELSFLSAVPPYKTNNYGECSFLRIAGETYPLGISVGRTGYSKGEGYALYNLNAMYKTLSFDLGNVDERGVAKDQRLEIYLDEKLVWSHDLDPEELPTHHVVDVTGGNQLKIKGSEWGGDYAMFNMYITKNK